MFNNPNKKNDPLSFYLVYFSYTVFKNYINSYLCSEIEFLSTLTYTNLVIYYFSDSEEFFGSFTDVKISKLFLSRAYSKLFSYH